MAADPGDLFLRNRGLEPLGGVWPEDLRLHPALAHPHADGLKFPAILAAVRNVRGELVTVHRIYLEQKDGAWDRLRGGLAPRVVAGPYSGSAIRLAPAAEVMGIAEGFETAFACMLLYGIPFWSVLAGFNLAKVDLPFAVRMVVIAQDNDPSGAGATYVRKAVFAHRALRRRVNPIAPTLPAPADFDDVLIARRRAGLPVSLPLPVAA